MSQRTPEPIFSLPAAADYSATKPRFVTPNSSGQFALTGAGAQATGVMSNAPKAGDQARCEWGGTMKIEAGTGGLALGDKVASDANGKGVATGADKYHMGIVVVPAAAGAVAQFIWSPGYTKA